MLSALLVLSGAAYAPAADDWMTLGEATFFGQTDPDSRKLPERKVSIRFPLGALPPVDESKPHVDWGGWKVQLNQWGNLGRVYRGGGGWDEFKGLWEDAQKRIAAGKSAVWKCKAVIFKRTSVLYKSAAGVLNLQRGFMDDKDVQFCLETFARYKACVEAFTGGAVNLQITAGIEEEPARGFYEGADIWSLHPMDAGDNYLRGRFNRGDFDCILYMYPPDSGRAFSFGGTQGRTNNCTQSYVILAPGREGAGRIGHTEAMLHEWMHQVQDTCGKWGYGGVAGAELPDLHAAQQNGYTTDEAGYTGWFSWMRDLMQFSIRQGMWAKVKNHEEPDWTAVRAQTHPSDGASFKWADVQDDPWAKLPYLTANNLAGRLGASSFEIKTSESQVLFLADGVSPESALREIDPEDVGFNNELNFGKEGMARVGNASRDLVFARFDLADVVAAGLAHATVIGYLAIDNKLMVVFDSWPLFDARCELNVLDFGSGINIEGKGEYVRGEAQTIRFTAKGSRFSVVGQDGKGLAYEAGKLDLTDKGGVFKVVSAADDGSRTERWFAARVIDPVQARLEAEPRRMSGSSLPIRLSLRNGSKATTVSLSRNLPAGYELAGLPNTLEMSPQERRTLFLTLSATTAQEGTAKVQITVSGTSHAIDIERATGIVLQSDGFETGLGGWAVKRLDSGGWLVAGADGGFSGKCLAISDGGGTRFGRVSAFAGGSGYDAAAYPYLDFYLKSASEATAGLSVTLNDGKRYVAMLTGPYLEQWGEAKQLPRAKFIPNGEWQHVVYDLGGALKAAAPDGPLVVTDIGFGDSRQFSSNQTPGENPATWFLDEFQILRNADVASNSIKEDPDAELASSADPTSTKSEDRCRAAAAINSQSSPEALAAVRAMLSSNDKDIRLNTAAAFGRVKDPGSVAALAQAFKIELEPSIGGQLVRALEFQDTPEGWTALTDAIEHSQGGEITRSQAAIAIAKKMGATSLGTINIMLASRSWIARAEAASAIASIPTDEAQRLLMTFLLEVDPMVRIAVAKGAKADVDPVGRRMEWGSINDLSNVVRGYDYAALARSKDPVLRSRGYAGLKETDTDIRRIIAEELGNEPQDYHVQPLLGLLSDLNPEVRAAGLVSLLKMPGKRDFSEMSVLSGEDYEEVLVPLLEAAKEKKLEVPKAMLERLTLHRNADIRKFAKELGG